LWGCTLLLKVAQEYSSVSRFKPGEGKLTDSKIRVLLAADHAMFRQCMKEMLSTGEWIEVIGEAENGQEAVALAEKREGPTWRCRSRVRSRR
jgi:hypothetical protein